MTWGPLMKISPRSPNGTGFPASSAIITSVFGRGIPIVPIRSVPSIGLQVATGAVSVKPYPSASGTPVTAFHFSAVAFCTAMPPPTAIFKPEKSNLPKAS